MAKLQYMYFTEYYFSLYQYNTHAQFMGFPATDLPLVYLYHNNNELEAILLSNCKNLPWFFEVTYKSQIESSNISL